MDKHIIGENAGKLWRFMNQNSQHQWSLDELKAGTGFDDLELASAIGWLAREDKIQFELRHVDTGHKKAYAYLMLNMYY